MSMYKTIFWSEAYEDYASGAQVSSVSGDVLVFGESAFASLDEAVAYANGTLGGNAIIVKVASGKYDSYTVVNNGNVTEGVKQVMAVDFGGGNFNYDNGEYSREVTMEAAGFTAEEQSEIVDALNADAADGIVYVAGKVAGNAVSTIYVGSTESFKDIGDLSGISETVDKDNQIKNDEAFVIVDKNSSIGEVVGSIEHEAGHLMGESHEVTDGTIKDFAQTDADLSKFYVNPAYAALDTGTAIEGMTGVYAGINAFGDYDSALNAAADGTVINVVGSNPYTFYVGKSDSETDVVVNFTGDVNALWKNMVRVDAGSTGNVINGSTLEYASFGVRGTLNAGSETGEKGIVTGKNFNVYGENGYPAAEINVYADSTLQVNDGSQNPSYIGHGSDANRKGELNILGGTASAKYLKVHAGTGEINVENGTLNVVNTLTNNGTVNVSGDSQLNIGSLTGNAVQVTADAKLTDSKVGGVVSVGYSQENAADTTLTLAGDTDITTLYVGEEGRENDYKLSVSGENTEVTLGNLYNRTDSVVEFTDGATANIGYWQSKGSVLIDEATVNHTGWNMYVYNNDSTSVAEIKLTNGATLNSDANYAIYLGNSEGGPAKGNAKITLESGSTLNTKNLTLHAAGTLDNAADGAATSTSVSVTDSTLNVTGTLTNNGTVNVAGESDIMANVSGDGWISMNGVTLDSDTSIKNGKVQFAGGVNTLDNAVIEGRTFQVGMAKNSNLGYDTEEGVTVNVNNNSVIGAGGTTYDGWVGSAYGTASDKEGVNYTLNIDESQAHFGYLHVSSDGAMNVTGHTADDNKYESEGKSVDFYAGTFITNGETVFSGTDAWTKYTKVSVDTDASSGPGKLNITNGANYQTVISNGSPTTGKALEIWNDGIVNVDNASLMVGNNADIQTADGQLNVNNGKLEVKGNLTNNGTVTVGGESTLDIANMTGSNIQAADGAVIKDSTIGGGGITATGDLTLKGENTFDSFSMGYFGHDVTIGADASLETTGTGRLTLAYANTLDVDGSITDAKTADKATTKKSLNIKGGVSITGNASFGDANNGATLDVDNAYISLGSTTSKNSAATGDFVLDFNNSIVEFTKDFQIAASSPDSGLTPTYQLNIKDSVMTVADRFAFNHENGTAVIDNSTLDITNQFKNVGNFTLQNGSEMSVGGNADGPSYEKTGNFGTLNVKSGSTFAMADDAATAYPFYNAGTVNVDGATFNVANVKNEGNFTVSGESTLDIAAASGNAIQLLDGAIIKDSTVGGAVSAGNGEFSFAGDNAFTKLRVVDDTADEAATVLNINDGTLTVNNPGFTGDVTFNGNGKVQFLGGTFMQNGDYVINTEIGVDGNGGRGSLYFTNSAVTVNADITQTNAGGEIIYINGSDVTVNAGATINGSIGIYDTANNGVLRVNGATINSGTIYANSDLYVTDGTINVGTISFANNPLVNLTVTADKLATVGNDAYYIINQTGTGAALNNTVAIDGTEYSIGDKITVGDIVYTVTNGDGNDIAIEALATVFFVDASYDENTDGYGFNKFSSFDDAVKALKNNDTVIKLFSDAEMSETTDPSFKLNVVSGDGSKHTLKINDATIDVDANFAKEIDIDTDLFMAYYNNHNVVVDGDLKGGIYNYDGTLTLNNSKITNSWDNSNVFGVVNINGDGTWTLDNAQADNLKFIGIGRNSDLNQGILNLNDTVIKAIQYTVDSQSANTKSQINAVNSTIGTVLNDGGWGNLIVTANGEVNLTNSNLDILGTLTNDGEINVTGESDLVANVTGNGIVYMDGVTLDADTKLYGANVRFASGVNTIDGAIIDNGKFQIGQGQYNNTDSRIDMANGITVNVQNNAYIGAVDDDYYGWIGTGFYDTDAEKLANMTDARYTLNIDKSTASFGYMHVSNDGIMNVTGVAESKEWYNNSDYSFYTGRFIVNGEATFDAADTLVSGTIVSSDNGTENGGHLVITNGTYYEAESHDGADDARVNLDVRKTGVVDVDGGSTLYVGGKVSVAEDAVINIDGANFEATGTVTNAGKINVSGESSINVAQLTGEGKMRVNKDEKATLTASNIGGSFYTYGETTLLGDVTTGNFYVQDTGTVNIGAADQEKATVTVQQLAGFGDINITNANVTHAYAFLRNDVKIKDSTVTNSSVNTYVAGNNVTTIDNSSWIMGAFSNIGEYDGFYYGNSNFTVTNKSEVSTSSMRITEKDDYEVKVTINDSTFNAATSLKVDGAELILENGAVLNAASVTNEGTVSVNDSTVKADTFNQYSATGAEFNNVDMDVTNFVNGADGTDAYAVIGGNSKVQIDKLSGYYALRLADGTTLKGGTNIVGSTSVRALGDVTFGETENDFVHIDSFDNNNAAGNTMTVNGTLDISSTGKGYNTYWLGVNGNADTTTLTGNGTINSNTATILQNGKIVVDEGLTLNVTDQYAADLRFTLTDITIKGEIHSIGSNNKQVTLNSSDLVITGENASLVVDDYMLVGYDTYYAGGSDTTDAYKSTITVEDGATLEVGGRLIINKNSVLTIEAGSSFTAGTIENNGGMVNSTTAGEIVVNQDLTVAGVIATDTLTLNAGAALSVGTLTVDNLNLAIGSDLSVTGTGSSIGTVTITGDLVPENAEFVLVSSGWANLGEPTVMYKGEEYTVVTDSVDGLTGLNFVTKDGNLYVKDFGAEATGIYIGELPEGAQTGDKITTDDGATYTVGKDAFANAADAATALGDSAANITSINLGNGDHVDEVAEKFVNVETITIDKGVKVEDTAPAGFTGDLVINNDGHLDAQITVKGDLVFTNTAKDTLVGSYTAENIEGTNTGAMAGSYAASYNILIDNSTGTIGGDKGAASFTADYVAITGGDASNVTVDAGTLELTDTNSFGMNSASGVLTGGNYGPDQILLNGSANMSIDGDLAASDVDIESELTDHKGTLTLNGDQTFSGDITANKIVVADGKVVTFDQNTVNFNELNVEGILNADFTQMDSHTSGGSLTGAGNLNTTHDGAWIVNDSVTRDLSGFTGTVTMEKANASIVMGNGDIDPAAADADSYFADGSKVVVSDSQSAVLAGNGVDTGINFSGAGTINVGEYDDVFAEQTEDFTQTLSGDNTGFTGAINVSEGAKLTVENALGANSINMDYETTQSATDVADKYDTQLILNKENLDLAATIKGDANDIIDVEKDATLSKDEALNGFEGTVKVNDNTLTLGGVNNTNAKFSGTTDAVIDANANQTLKADKALNGFEGTVALDGNTLTLDGVNNTNAKFSGTTDAVIDANKAQTLAADGALNDFKGEVALEGNTLTLDGANETEAKFTGTNLIDANADQTLKVDGALNGFEGTVALEGNTLTLDGANETSAKFTGTNLIDANANQTLNGAGALDAFSGKVELEGNDLTLNAKNTTSAEFIGNADAALNVNADQFLNADNTNFDGKLNINSKAEVQFNGDFGTVNGNSTINFNANDSSIYVAPGYAVDINSKLVSNTVSGEIFYIGGEATLTADGALDNFDGTLRLSDKDANTKLILEGNNTTNATLYSVNSNILHSVELNGGDLTLTNNDALKDYYGAIKVNNNKITLDVETGSFSATSATFYGNSNAVMNVNDSITMFGNPNNSYNQTGKDAISGFAGTINVADNATLTIDSTNTTAAKFVSESGTLVFAANNMSAANTLTSDGALDNMKGNIVLSSGVGVNSGASLVLNGINTTEADVSGDLKSVITANANQYFTGDVSSFSGTYDIADGANVTLSGTIADVINAQGDTLTLSNTTTKDITVNAGAGSELENLAFGANNVVLGAGDDDDDDFTNVKGTGDILDFGDDQTFGTVEAGTINVTGSQDALTIDKLTADINITIDAAQEDDKSDVTINDDFAGSISVNIKDSDYLATSYKIATNGGFTSDTTISLTVEGNAAAEPLKVDDRVILGGESYLLKLKDETLILTKLPGYSNYVVVDGDWKEQDPYESVMDGNTERYIGYDAAHDLTDAVGYIRGYDKGVNANAGTNMGDATIELTEGKYTLANGTYLMNGTNEVTQLTLKGRDDQTATLSGVVVASDGTKETTLNVNNVRIQGELYGGGNLVIDNAANLRTTGNVIAAGVADSDMENDSKLTINGGYFGHRLLVGGSVNNSSEKITVDGDTAVVIDNQSAENEKLVITSNIVGGSWAASGDVEQNGNASILINVEKATQIRGNIFVNGGEGNGKLTMNGDSEITFTGDADLLTFTGTVNAINGTDTTEAVVFDDFEGEFNGSFAGFDVITIEGSTSLELGRRQNKTGETSLAFVVNSDSANNDAMYTVRDANNWEFKEDITITTDAFASAGDYVLVDNYKGGFEDFTFTIDGITYNSLEEAESAGLLTYENNQLIYTNSATPTVQNGGELSSDISNTAVKLSNVTNANGVQTDVTGKTVVLENTKLNNATISGSGYTGDISISVDSDSVVGHIVGTTTANPDGDIELNVDSMPTTVYGVSGAGASADDVTINVGFTNGKYNFVAIGTGDVTINGDSVIVVEDGAKYSTKNAEILVGGIYGTSTGTIKGDTLVEINEAEITTNSDAAEGGNIVGGGSGTIEGDSGVVINGATIDVKGSAIYGGAAWGGTVSDSYVTVNGGEITLDSEAKRAIYGGSSSSSDTTTSATVTINDGDINANIYGGSRTTAVANTKVVINGGDIDSTVIGAAGFEAAATAGSATVEINDGSVTATTIDGAKAKTDSSILDINGGFVEGAVKDFDQMSMDVDAVLNGTVTGVETLDVTGLEDVVAAGNVAGAKTIVGGVDDVLAGAATIDGETLTSGKVQLAGADGEMNTSDDIWASLTKNSDNSLTVAWGRTETEMADALDAFKADSTLAIGDAVVATATSLGDSDTTNDFSKKENGKLA